MRTVPAVGSGVGCEFCVGTWKILASYLHLCAAAMAQDLSCLPLCALSHTLGTSVVVWTAQLLCSECPCIQLWPQPLVPQEVHVQTTAYSP